MRLKHPMDAVYFFRHSGAADEELRYSLRSVERHAPWIRRIWIVGDRPTWLGDSDRVSHVAWESLAPSFGFKLPMRNVFRMFVAVTAIEGLAEEFLCFSDDFVIVRDLSPADARKDRYRRDYAKHKRERPHLYQDALARTQETLLSLGYPALDFDAHVPQRLTKRRVLDAFADLGSHTADGRFKGMIGKVAILNHAMKREGFKPLRSGEPRIRAVYNKTKPTAAKVQRDCEAESVLFVNFDDDAYGPGIRDFLHERFPEPAPWENDAPQILSFATATDLHVHVVKASGWIIGRIADAIRCGRTTVGARPDPKADVNLFVNYQAMRERRPGTLSVAWMTHLPPADELRGRKRRQFFDVAHQADWCLAMSEATALHCPPGKTSVWGGAPDAAFVKPTLRLGVACKPGPRKGLDKLAALKAIPGVEVVETGGKLSLAELPKWYASLDYLVVTSDLEGGPYPVMEAIASGKPVIAPDVGWCWDYPCLKYDGTAEGLASVVRKLRFPADPWGAANRELDAILRGLLERRTVAA